MLDQPVTTKPVGSQSEGKCQPLAVTPSLTPNTNIPMLSYASRATAPNTGLASAAASSKITSRGTRRKVSPRASGRVARVPSRRQWETPPTRLHLHQLFAACCQRGEGTAAVTATPQTADRDGPLPVEGDSLKGSQQERKAGAPGANTPPAAPPGHEVVDEALLLLVLCTAADDARRKSNGHQPPHCPTPTHDA